MVAPLYRDHDFVDADRDDALVGDLMDPAWPDTLRLDRPSFTPVSRASYPARAARSQIHVEPGCEPHGQLGDGTPPPSPSPVPTNVSGARRSPGAA